MLITCLKDTAKNANKTSFFSSSYLRATHGLMVVIGEDNCAMQAGFHTGDGGGGTGIPLQKFESHNCLNSYNRVYNTITKYSIIIDLLYYS